MDQPSSDEEFTVSLVVATRARPDALEPRIPVWTSAGFDDVVIVDGSYDRRTRARVEDLCERTGARYVPVAITLGDTRSLARNLGAQEAGGSWILFQDDDDDVPVRIDKMALRRVAHSKDWLTGRRGEIIVWHRRVSFLAFGGYPEDMVAGEDWIMSNRARGAGTGALEPAWYDGTRTFPPPSDDPLGRSRNAFWYGYTLGLYVLRCPRRASIIQGDARRTILMLLKGLRAPRYLFYLGIGLFARSLSPVYCVRIALKTGLSSLRQEHYNDWQGLREDLDSSSRSRASQP